MVNGQLFYLEFLLLAFYSNLFKVFDENELEYLMCGITQIDVEDWCTYTEYKSGYSSTHHVVVWFWKVSELFTLGQNFDPLLRYLERNARRHFLDESKFFQRSSHDMTSYIKIK